MLIAASKYKQTNKTTKNNNNPKQPAATINILINSSKKTVLDGFALAKRGEYVWQCEFTDSISKLITLGQGVAIAYLLCIALFKKRDALGSPKTVLWSYVICYSMTESNDSELSDVESKVRADWLIAPTTREFGQTLRNRQYAKHSIFNVWVIPISGETKIALPCQSYEQQQEQRDPIQPARAMF